jgi:hypothetical protein
LRKEDALYVEEEEAASHILLKCLEAKWREQFFSRKWLIDNEEVAAYNRILNCTTAVELRNIGK